MALLSEPGYDRVFYERCLVTTYYELNIKQEMHVTPVAAAALQEICG